MTAGKKCLERLKFFIWIFSTLISIAGCTKTGNSKLLEPKISLVNSPTDILTLGANYLARKISEKTGGAIQPKVYHSGVLSGGKGGAEIEMCQEGAIEMHITTTAYLANLVPKSSVVSLPFLFRDIDQVVRLAESNSPSLAVINGELNKKNLHVIAWWPRGFRQLTNSKRTVHNIQDIRGLKFRVMNNALFVDIMNELGAYPVPMAWGEVYNGLQLNTIDGQENAEDVVYSSKLYEVQKYMTIWDYSTDIEVVLVNLDWWNSLSEGERLIIQQVADRSVEFEVALLKKNTMELREKIKEKGVRMYYLSPEEKFSFRKTLKPVWDKYEKEFTPAFLQTFLEEVEKY